jgi:hypothetical protein
MGHDALSQIGVVIDVRVGLEDRYGEDDGMITSGAMGMKMWLRMKIRM